MDNVEKIIIAEKCYLCEEHQTDLGTLIRIFTSIGDNFAGFPQYWIEFTKLMYEQHKLDQRTKMIQFYKKSNIKDIRK